MLSRELSRFIEAARQPAASPASNIHYRSLSIEPLEDRCLMTAVSSAAVDWFQQVATAAGHAGTAVWTTNSTTPTVTDTVTAALNASNQYDWIIQFDTNALAGITSVAQTGSLLAGAGINFEVISGLGLPGMVLARSTEASYSTVCNWLSHDASVADYEEDAFRSADAAYTSVAIDKTWGQTQIDAAAADNSLAAGGPKVVVAELDTGIDYTDTALANCIWTNPEAAAGGSVDNGGFVGDVHGYNFVANDGNPMDDNGHGTHVAGIIDSVFDSSPNTASSLSIMAVKFMNADGSGYLSDAIRAINYVTMMRTQYDVNVRVINASWGSTTFSADMNTAIQAAGNAGILFVAAAGNTGTNNDVAPEYPANSTATNVLAVAASDKNDHLASFSNYGPSTVDVAAPGVTIYSTLPGNFYGAYSGTSMAAPYVSAVAALCWVADPNATVSQVRNAVIDGCDTNPGLTGNILSGGRVDAYKTVEIIRSETPQGPTIGTLSASLSDVYAGSSVTLAANGIAAGSSPITSVSFYQDTNGNGQLDSGDKLVGTTSQIIGGQASVSLDTSTYAAGRYQFIAVATDGNSRSATSSPVTVTVWQNDHGTSAATASPVSMGSTVSGTIEIAGGVDWYKFQAVAGTTYTFSTQLGTLSGTVLNLYGSDGATVLLSNGSAAANSASKIAWTPTTSGTYYLVVAAGGSAKTGTYTLSLQSQTAGLTLAPIPDQTMSAGQTRLDDTLSATNPSGGRLTYSAKLLVRNAKSGTLVAMIGTKVTASMAGNRLTINRLASYTGDFYVQVSVSDGAHTSTQTFHVTISPTATAASTTAASTASARTASLASESLQVGAGLLGGRPTLDQDTLAAVDRQYQSMAAEGTGKNTSASRVDQAADGGDPSQTCLDQVAALRAEVAALLQGWQSREEQAIDSFFGNLDE